MPENLRLLLILEPADFDALVAEVVPPWAQLDTDQPDRFIYTTQVGIEFGIKKKTIMEDFSMETFLTAIESHPKACAFLILMAILTCTFRFRWIVGKEGDTYYVDNKPTK